MADDTAADPSPLIERIKGKVKQVTGSVLGNESLVREGELHEEKAEHVQDADRLEAEASQSAEEADLDLRDHELDLEQQRLTDEAAASARDERLERDRQTERARIAQQTDARMAATNGAEQAEKAAAARDEVQAVDALDTERRRAANLDAKAERKLQRADDLDNTDRP